MGVFDKTDFSKPFRPSLPYVPDFIEEQSYLVGKAVRDAWSEPDASRRAEILSEASARAILAPTKPVAGFLGKTAVSGVHGVATATGDAARTAADAAARAAYKQATDPDPDSRPASTFLGTVILLGGLAGLVWWFTPHVSNAVASRGGPKPLRGY